MARPSIIKNNIEYVLATFDYIITKMKRYFWLLVVVVMILPTFFSLLRPGIHNIQDNMQYFRIYEMNKCAVDSQIPCRWVPDLGYGFGYPLFLYYSPGPYYVGELIHLVGFQYIDVVKMLFISGFVVSAIGMYFLLFGLLADPVAATVGSLLYVYTPVRAVQVYVRGSLGEFLAMAIFPFLFLFVYRIVKHIGNNNVLWLGVSTFCLLVTHNLMSLAFFPILGIWILSQIWLSKQKDVWKKILLGLCLGLGMAAFFVLPVIFEQGFVHLESMTGGYFDYRQHFVDLYQLFISNHWGYGSSMLGPNDDLSLSAGIVQWVLALISVVIAVINYKKDKKRSMIIFILAGVVAITLFLTHQRSAFIWETFGFMKIFQFPWRLLALSSFILPIIVVYGITQLKKKHFWVIGVGAVIFIFVLNGNFFHPQRWLNINDNDLLTENEFIKQQTASIFDYLPISAKLPPNYEAPLQPEVTVGTAIVGTYLKGSDWQSGAISVQSETAKIRLPIFDFPGMSVTDFGRPIEFNHDDCVNQDYCFGQISVLLPKGEHQILVELKKTWPRTLGDILSVLTFGGTIYIFIRRKDWLC
jgi:hypothetical protein